MSTIEMEIRKMKTDFSKQISELKKIIVTRLIVDKWVQQDVACALLHVKTRQLRNLRVHIDKEGKKVGSISWKKGAGKNVLYNKEDIERYNSMFTIMN